MATETQRHREEYRKLKAIFCCFTLLLLYSVALWLCGSVALWQSDLSRLFLAERRRGG